MGDKDDTRRAAALLDRICGIIHMTASQREARINWIADALREAERRVWQEAEQYARECKAVETDRAFILAWHKIATYCKLQLERQAAARAQEGKPDGERLAAGEDKDIVLIEDALQQARADGLREAAKQAELHPTSDSQYLARLFHGLAEARAQEGG